MQGGGLLDWLVRIPVGEQVRGSPVETRDPASAPPSGFPGMGERVCWGGGGGGGAEEGAGGQE